MGGQEKKIDFSDFGMYSGVPNKRTGRLLENEKKSYLYALIWDYLFMSKKSHLYFYTFLNFFVV